MLSRAFVLGGAVTIVLTVGCGGGKGDECRANSDCTGDLYCRGPDDPPVCGIGPQQQCSSDAQCFGTVCHATYDTCSQDGIGSRCGPSCVDSPCETDFRCNAHGACEPVPCGEGYTCPAYQLCTLASPYGSVPTYDLSHGCLSVACDDDRLCPEGACTNGFCQSGPGSCQEVQLVP